MDESKIPSIKILTDDIETKPTSEFQKISQKVAGIIFGTFPKITIGIYGEWGTGKSTLMRQIQENLGRNDVSVKIPSIWFNAWRYEREEINSTIPLIAAIINEFQTQIKLQNKNPSNKIKNSLEKAKSYSSMVSGSISVGIKGIASATLEIDSSKTKDDSVKSFIKNNLPTIQKGIEIIEELKIQLKSDLPNKLKFVVFIDDLDRCSPERALEIFESMKVLLDLEGIVYVLGISHETIDKLITAAYKDAEIKGKDYIRKIIQIPIQIPIWNKKDIKEIMQKNLIPILDKKHALLIKTNEDLISIAVENNPRELKRFINRIILAKELAAKNNSIIDKELLVSEALSNRWPEQFNSFLSDSELMDLSLKYSETKDFISRKTTIETEQNDVVSPTRRKKLLLFPQDLWEFIYETKKILSKLDLDKYSKLTASFKTPSKKYITESFMINILCKISDVDRVIRIIQMFTKPISRHTIKRDEDEIQFNVKTTNITVNEIEKIVMEILNLPYTRVQYNKISSEHIINDFY